MPSLQRPRQSPDRRRRSLVRINLHLLLPPSYFFCFDGWHGKNRTTEITWRNRSSEWAHSLADKYSKRRPLQTAVAASARRSHNPAKRYTDSRVAASVSIAPERRVRPRRDVPGAYALQFRYVCSRLILPRFEMRGALSVANLSFCYT